MDFIHYNGDVGDGENVTSNDNAFLRNQRILLSKKATPTTNNSYNMIGKSFFV